MGMEPLNSITSIQAQTMNRPVTSPKANSETTEGTAVDTAVPKLDNSTTAVAKNQESNAQQGYDSQDQSKNGQQTGNESLKKAVENINKNLNNSEAIFGIHEATNRVTIKIVDKDTKEVIKELPPEKTLDMIAKAWELAGILVDEKR
jgi:flagellar protein FlaG